MEERHTNNCRYLLFALGQTCDTDMTTDGQAFAYLIANEGVTR
jgi:hypothetical protein